jgi:hypothetical protein
MRRLGVGRFGTLSVGQVSVDGINGHDIHRLENIITMDNNKHNMLDHLLI